MKVWWCEEHNSYVASPVVSMGPLTVGMCQWYSLTQSEGQNRCRMTEMQLVPADALVIQKENGKWPEWATINWWVSPQILDRLKEAQP